MSKKYNIWTVSKKDSKTKLLTFLKEKLCLSNRQIKRILDKGFCLVNNKIERFGSISLKNKDEVKLHSSWENEIEEKKIKSLKILFEDQYFIAIDKPLNFVCTDRNIHLFFPKKYTLIHRLDKDTTGILLIAKSFVFKQKMVNLFKQFKVRKTYLAYVDGQIKEKDRKIASKIKKKKSVDGQNIYTSALEGKYALTYLHVIKRYKNVSFVELNPVTGRTHQLRVHMKQISHPILGDFLYSKSFSYKEHIARLMLHCLKIEFAHPMIFDDISIISEPDDSFNIN